MSTHALSLENAIAELDRLDGWRAALLLKREADDPEGLVAALPWVTDGSPRAGTLVRLSEHEDGLLLVTGGALRDEEGARLFEIHEALRDMIVHAIILPPRTAAPALIERMWTSNLMATAPHDPAPSSVGFGGAGVGFSVLGGYYLRTADWGRSYLGGSGLWMLAPLVVVALLAIPYAILRARRNEIVSHPLWILRAQWFAHVPPRAKVLVPLI
jgi:hypothetical protein